MTTQKKEDDTMTRNERSSLVKMGATALRSGKGGKTFVSSAIMASAVAFFAMFGVLTLVTVMMLSNYGMARAFAEMHAVSPVDAVMVLRGFALKNLAPLVLSSVVIGSLFGLKDVGQKERRASDTAS